jgi:hypothetical protein
LDKHGKLTHKKMFNGSMIGKYGEIIGTKIRKTINGGLTLMGKLFINYL